MSLMTSFWSVPRSRSRQRIFYVVFFSLYSLSFSFHAPHKHHTPRIIRLPDKRSQTCLSSSPFEDLNGAIHRKEYEMAKLAKEHTSPSDPLQMAMGYIQESTPPLRLARALRRVYEDPENPANPDYNPDTSEEEQTQNALMNMRRPAFVADIKRKSLSYPGETFVNFDDAGAVAASMVGMGADAVFVNIDYNAYGGDISELRSVISSIRKVSKTTAIVMKDIVVNELQLALAKDAGADGVLLIAAVLGPALENFLNLCSIVGLEAVVECHTKNEVEAAMDCLAQNIMVTNYDRITGNYYPDQAEKLAGMFPGSGGPIISMACGGISTQQQVRKVLGAGYDAVVIGKAIMGNSRTPEIIKAVRERPLLPAEFSGWGLEDVDFEKDGSVMLDKDGKPKVRKGDLDDPESEYQ